MDDVADDLMEAPGEGVDTKSPEHRRGLLAGSEGDISHIFSETDLARIGQEVVEDYERDLADTKDWRDRAEKAVKAAAQEKPDGKDYPWQGASNVKYPMLTVAALQFNARAYPAIVKGDEAVAIKVVGRDAGRPIMGPDGQPQMQLGGMPVMQTPQGPMVMTPQGPQAVPDGAPVAPAWQVQPGAKKKRAERVKDYLNAYLFYRMKGWEQDTDQLLMLLPIVGCMFRKVYQKGSECRVRLVSGLKLVAPMWAVDCATSPRLTEMIDNLASYQVKQRMKSGFYRDIELVEDAGDDEEKPRLILEQHRYMDADGDDKAEPYVITVDHETKQVLRIEANFGPEQADDPDGDIDKASVYYVKYDFLPNPDGGFYGIGFGHLMTEITEVINTTINQLIDAGTAQIAGGGFIASGVRLQAKGQTSVRFRPGEYKVVDASANDLRNGFIERTFPQPSTVAFQLLDMMLSAAKDIGSVKDVITGDASNNGQVGTTLALIEQGLQVFTAIYKRIYRSLREEFTLIFECLSHWGGEAVAQDYLELLDDPEADFTADFNLKDMDIRPVSDPTSVTKMQKMSRAQFLGNFLGRGLNDEAIFRRMFEAADVEDIDELFPQGPPPPNPLDEAKVASEHASAAKDAATAQKTALETTLTAHNAGMEMAHNGDGRGLPSMAGAPSNPMGDGSGVGNGGGMQGGMGNPLMGG